MLIEWMYEQITETCFYRHYNHLHNRLCPGSGMRVIKTETANQHTGGARDEKRENEPGVNPGILTTGATLTTTDVHVIYEATAGVNEVN